MKSSLGSVASRASGDGVLDGVGRDSATEDVAPASQGNRSGVARARMGHFADLLSELSAANDASPPSDATPAKGDLLREDEPDEARGPDPDARAVELASPQAQETPFGTPFVWPTEVPVQPDRNFLPEQGAGGMLESNAKAMATCAVTDGAASVTSTTGASSASASATRSRGAMPSLRAAAQAHGPLRCPAPPGPPGGGARLDERDAGERRAG